MFISWWSILYCPFLLFFFLVSCVLCVGSDLSVVFLLFLLFLYPSFPPFILFFFNLCYLVQFCWFDSQSSKETLFMLQWSQLCIESIPVKFVQSPSAKREHSHRTFLLEPGLCQQFQKGYYENLL